MELIRIFSRRERLATLALILVAGCSSPVATELAEDCPTVSSPFALFLSDLEPGMSRRELRGTIHREYPFAVPIVCSIHDPGIHFNFLSNGVLAFHFDESGRFVTWRRWQARE